jgi:hypothetical protein
MFGLDPQLEKFINQCLKKRYDDGIAKGKLLGAEYAKELVAELLVNQEKDQRNLRRYKKKLRQAGLL